MADENISVALTDDGTIEQITALLEIFGLSAEEAAQRAQSAFVNVSRSQDAATASAKVLSAAQTAGVTATDSLALAFSKLTTAEASAAAADDALARSVQALATAQTDSVAAAVALARALADEAAEAEAAGAASEGLANRFGGIATAAESVTAATRGMNVSQQETVALLTQLGLGAQEAATRVSEGYSAAGTSSQLLATQTAALGVAAETGYVHVEELATAISLLSTAEQQAISNASGMAAVQDILTNAVIASNSAFAAQEQIVLNESGSFSAAANAADALAAAQARLADFMAADAAAAADLARSLTGVAAAEETAGAAAVTFGERVTAVAEAGRTVGSTFGGLNAIFASAFATSEIIKATDEFTKIQASLHLATSSATEFNSVYSQLKDLANQTQTPLESNVNTFVQFSEAGKKAGLSANDIVGAIRGIDDALKLGNVSGQQATATMRSLSEVFEQTDGSATRFLQNLKRESPTTFALVQQAADTLGISLTEFATKTGDATTKQRDFVAILTQVGKVNSDAAASITTVGGALTVLKNDLIDFAGSSTTANASMTLLKDAIFAVAGNLNTIIPLVVAFGAAVVAVKVASLVSDLAALGSSLLALAFTPVGAAVIAFTVAVVALGAAVQGIINYFRPANDQISLLGTASSVAQQAMTALSGGVTSASNALKDHAVSAKASTDATTANTTAVTEGQLGYAKTAQSVIDANNAIRDAAQATEAHTAKVYADYQAQQQAIQGNTAYASSFTGIVNAINSAITALGNYISAAAKAAAAAIGLGNAESGSNPAGLGHAREGGTFAVAGASGVDSKLIAVSPGEVVTVQTPAQYAAGVAPQKRAAQTHFATGGVSTGAGVDLGLGVSLTRGAPASPGSSVTGFSDGRSGQVGALTTAANSVSASLSTNTTATAANTSSNVASAAATGGNILAVNANSNSLAAASNAAARSAASVGSSSASSANSLSQALQANGRTIADALNKEVTAANDNTQAITSNTGALGALSQTVVNAVNSLGQTVSSAATAISAAASTVVSAANSVSTAASVVMSTTSPSATTSSGVSPATGLPIFNGISLISNNPNGLTGALRGGSVSASEQSGLVLVDQYGYDSAGNQIGDDSVAREREAVRAYDNASTLNKQKPIGGSVYDNQARDGADFFVPGGDGVDSRVLKLAVSPGESVHVRTPEQRVGAQSGSIGGLTQVVNIQVIAKDADSFAASNDQLAARAIRGFRRAGRKN